MTSSPITCSLLSLDDSDKIQTLPKDLTKKIIDYCSLSAFGAINQLSNDWKNFTNNLWKKKIYQTFACDNNDWIKNFPTLIEKGDGDFNSLPLDLVIKDCRILKNKYPSESLQNLFFAFWAPKLANNSQQTVESLGSFLKLKFPSSIEGYKEVANEILEHFKQNVIDSSRWIFMIRTFRPVKNSYGEGSESLINAYKKIGLEGYKVSNIGETMTGLLAGYLKTNNWIFATPKIYILCQEVFNKYDNTSQVLRTYDVSISVENIQEKFQGDTSTTLKKIQAPSLIALTDNPIQGIGTQGVNNDQNLSFDAHIILVKTIESTPKL